MKHLKYGIIILALTSTACTNTLNKLENVGKAPELEKIDQNVKQVSYQPLNWPIPIESSPSLRGANSLWAPSSRSFFNDHRAYRVGDILTVMIDINDEADLANSTEKTRGTQESLAAPNFLGLEEKLLKVLPGDPQLNNLLSLNGSNNHSGEGTIEREEEIRLKLAAMVVQVLPNGNLVIHGSQQVRVNYEMRNVSIDGVIRSEDISSTNTINADQIAQARISYGGEGDLTDMQQPRYGTQVMDILAPF